MRTIINYICSCFCKHEWELLSETRMWDNPPGRYPLGTKWTHRCKKCGYIKTYKNY